MFLTKLFALFWLIPLVVSGSCPQDQKQISVRVTAEFRLHSFIKTVDHETTITASRNFSTTFKKCRLAMESGNSASSFGDAVQNILDTVGLAIGTAEGDKTENVDTKRNGDIQQWQNEQKESIITNFLQLVRVITYSVRVDREMAKIQEKTFVDSIPLSSTGNYGGRLKYGATFIEEMFQNEKNGNIVDNTFTMSICYNESSHQLQEINELAKLTVKLNRFSMELQQMNTSLKQMNTRQLNSLKIVKAHGGLLADKCKFTCVGTTGRNTSWTSGGTGYMNTTVNMASCGFVDVPVVTTSLEGSDYNSDMTGTAAPRLVTTVQFQIYIKGWIQTSHKKQAGKPTAFTAKSYKWNVNWAAYGYKEC